MEVSASEKMASLEDVHQDVRMPERSPSVLQSREDIDMELNAPGSTTPDSGFVPGPGGKAKPPDMVSLTRRSSAEIGAPAVVPRLKRRGLCGQFTLIAEVENPKEYLRRTKWFLTFVVAFAGSAAPMGSSIFFRMYLP
jgi:hypothetical protein